MKSRINALLFASFHICLNIVLTDPVEGEAKTLEQRQAEALMVVFTHANSPHQNGSTPDKHHHPED